MTIQNWSDVHYRSAAEAIASIDATVHAHAEKAERILSRLWTALTVLLHGKGVPDADLLTACGAFAKLPKAALERVRDAIEMRQRAFAGAA